MVTRKTATPNRARTRVARTTITSSELLSRSVCAVARGGGSALEPAARAPSSDVDWARRDAGDSPSSPPVEQCAVSEAFRCVRQVQLTYQRPHGRGPRRGGHKEVVHQTVHSLGTVHRRRTDFREKTSSRVSDAGSRLLHYLIFSTDVAACHRLVWRHTCSLVTRRSTRATQAPAGPGTHDDRPAQTLNQ